MAIWAQWREGLILPGPKDAGANGQAAGKESEFGGGRLRGAVLPASTSKGTALSAGRDLALLLFLSHAFCPINRSPNNMYFQEANDVILLCGLILRSSKSNFKSEIKISG